MKNLDGLLSEYEQKRRKAEMDLEVKIEELYKNNPELESMDDSLNIMAIKKTKAILNNNKNVEEIDLKINDLKQKRQEILKRKNIDLSFFEPEYECKICKDTGYIQNENRKNMMCNCLKQRLLDLSYNMSNLSDIKKENFENFNINLFSDEINAKKYKMNCSPRQNMIGIKEDCVKFIDNFDYLEEKNLLFLREYRTWKNIYVKLYCKRIVKKRENCTLSNSSSST